MSRIAAFRLPRRWMAVALAWLSLASGAAIAAAPVKSPPVDTNPLNRTPDVREGFERFYNMDYDGALARFERVLKAHPHDPIATDYVLNAIVFRELNRLDLLDTTFYSNDGFLTGKHTVVEDTAVRDEVRRLAGDAIAAADTQLNANSENVNALYARAWARGLESTYIAMVERGFASALHMALQSHSDDVEVLRLDPNYVDANLVAGTYEYVVGALPFSFRLVVGIAGIKGSKEKGMAMLQLAAVKGVITSVEARTCMMLFLRREARYGEALEIAHNLAVQYPHDFLFQLEEANLAKDAGTGMRAVDLYRRVIAQAQQPGYFYSQHPELAYFGLGESLRGQKLYGDAVAAYKDAAYSPKTSLELKRRCLLAAGKSFDLMGDHTDAVSTYEQVVAAGGDTVQADEARKWMKKSFTGQ